MIKDTRTTFRNLKIGDKFTVEYQARLYDNATGEALGDNFTMVNHGKKISDTEWAEISFGTYHELLHMDPRTIVVRKERS